MGDGWMAGWVMGGRWVGDGVASGSKDRASYGYCRRCARPPHPLKTDDEGDDEGAGVS